MSRSLVITLEAKDDLRAAARWYEDQSAGLGFRFMQAIDHALDLIALHPEIHAIVHRDGRLAKVERFPYAICYRLERSRILIFSVTHTSRDPAYWQDRLP
ncbi:Plasmid stabilization system protein [Anatilimnocola aggregata]|uniref:Plasmid stabilization system protein n=1 Tax=Anatilimnocola aggregata TaxID=2528021 RepID=A0A517Y5J3_9BACT|nr:Plasmid stabilization system protein [Anatilimnocola aggregata]